MSPAREPFPASASYAERCELVRAAIASASSIDAVCERFGLLESTVRAIDADACEAPKRRAPRGARS